MYVNCFCLITKVTIKSLAFGNFCAINVNNTKKKVYTQP